MKMFLGMIWLIFISILPLSTFSVIEPPFNRSVHLKYSSSDCQISPFDDYSPIVVLCDSNDYLYPTGEDSDLRFTNGECLNVICPGGNVLVGSQSYENAVTATCIGSTLFNISNKSVSWESISCNKVPEKTARRTGETCENNGKEIEIGFVVPDGFLRTILICFDESTQQALYSYAKISQSINKRKERPRPNWLQGTSLYNITSVDNYYKRANQRTTINELLNFAENSTSFIQDNDYFLARGHLTARSDNFYPSQQNQTFFLVNAAPQWQIINANNWYKVETSIRDYAEENQIDLLQWTGVYGVLSVNNTNNIKTELYLYSKNDELYIPVPEVFWKVVYDPISQKGAAIIGLNNPYAENYTVFCDDVSDLTKWVNFKKSNTAKGLIFVCNVNDFRKTVKYLPEFSVTGLLV
ncbi:hypothetical protein GWI33_010653 [Rhynchophorus ferrugineus]|uniref:DNA/RNA non-specific endonuclease/pyrophosphatase/phosphodiesterase domain-containing protein n=1 Tax=Rhynchophorus ferrugineus TaxID=354439 RepID=A0A834IWY5_RHYFE|nr:hypothetical protein GWI33_010653 [Rhynchophorus ferrugineus]